MITAPITQAHTASGPARRAALEAPNSQPEPMMEPMPVMVRAMTPTSRCREDLFDMEFPRDWKGSAGGPAHGAHHGSPAGLSPRGVHPLGDIVAKGCPHQ